MPGYVAMKICPQFLTFMDYSKPIIAVTGTNGKTTICAMLADYYRKQGQKVVNNQGFNTLIGLASYLIYDTTLSGRANYDVAVLEVDERTTFKSFAYIKPDYMICTNLFRDSMADNGHTEYITHILKTHTPEKTRLILNADDPLCLILAQDRKNVIWYGIDRLESDYREVRNIVRDLIYCPLCGEELTYDYYRYHHMGKYRCPNGDFSTPKSDYLVTGLDLPGRRMQLMVHGQTRCCDLISDSLFNAYNQVCVLALLCELGHDFDQVNASFRSIEVDASRYAETRAGKTTIIQHMAKGQNPIACSRVFDYIRREPGDKILFLMLDDIPSIYEHTSETVAWLYDTDFEFLKDERVKQYVVVGQRSYDVCFRLLMAGIDADKIAVSESELEGVELIRFDLADTIYLCYDLYAYDLSCQVRDKMAAMCQGGAR